MIAFILQSLFLIAAAFIIGAILGNVSKRFSPKRESVSEDSTKASDARLASQTRLLTPVNDDVKQSAVEAAAMIPPAEPVPARLAKATRSGARKTQPKPVAVAARHPQQDDKNRPALLRNARRGKPDKLVTIDGIGTVIESKLFALGIFHYDQIAAWSVDEANWVSNEIGFHGRALRENWVKQSAALMKPKPAPRAKAAAKPATKA
jgi:predicted flap endonuclease-1-like 5' DNA nuclease